MSNPYITPELFLFLRELRENNTREWFNDHKVRYEQHLKEPLLDLIADFAPLLSGISPHFRAIPKVSGGSLFRIYRDVRFSKNKSPYKTHASVHFRHEQAKDVHAPGYYLHIEPDNVFLGLGLWRPENSILTKIRSAIATDPELWEDILDANSFKNEFPLQGESLKRPPKGFDPEHRYINDLKHKDFMGVAQITEEIALRPDVLPLIAQTWEKGSPFMSFLAESVGIPF